jgi:hypothetical protein
MIDLEAIRKRAENLLYTSEDVYALVAEVERLKASMVEHFQREHLEGDGPEIDRWKREVERLKAAIMDYLSEYDAPVPDLGLRVRYRERLKALTGENEPADPDYGL